MILQRNSNVCRAYLWSLGVCELFLETSWQRYRRETNLCRFVRVLVLYGPLVLLCQFLVWCAVLAVVIVIPVRWFGVTGYGSTVVVIAASVAVLMGFVELAKKTKHRQARAPRPKSQTRAVIAAYLKAQKSKICPLISIVEAERCAK